MPQDEGDGRGGVVVLQAARMRPWRLYAPYVRGGRVVREGVSEWHRRMVGIDGGMRRMAARMPQDA
nr:MAG TPA: hypothetical protein [Caudoviricetes sp.]